MFDRVYKDYFENRTGSHWELFDSGEEEADNSLENIMTGLRDQYKERMRKAAAENIQKRRKRKGKRTQNKTVNGKSRSGSGLVGKKMNGSKKKTGCDKTKVRSSNGGDSSSVDNVDNEHSNRMDVGGQAGP